MEKYGRIRPAAGHGKSKPPTRKRQKGETTTWVSLSQPHREKIDRPRLRVNRREDKPRSRDSVKKTHGKGRGITQRVASLRCLWKRKTSCTDHTACKKEGPKPCAEKGKGEKGGGSREGHWDIESGKTERKTEEKQLSPMIVEALKKRLGLAPCLKTLLAVQTFSTREIKEGVGKVSSGKKAKIEAFGGTFKKDVRSS